MHRGLAITPALERAVDEIVATIPCGRVATYGQVAEMAGVPGAAIAFLTGGPIECQFDEHPQEVRTMDKLPPMEKIPEAYSAIADGRVRLGDGEAEVRSSDGAKGYVVRWDGDVYSSTDSATYWQGYAGYPVLAVLMLQGRLPLDMEIAGHFKGINWTALNARHRRDYAAALAEVMGGLRRDGVDTAGIDAEIRRVHALLPGLPIALKRGRRQAGA